MDTSLLTSWLSSWQARIHRLMGERGLSLRAVLVCFATLVMLNASPDNPFRPLKIDPADPGDWGAYEHKLREPFADVATSATDTSHASKLNYRLTVPLLCKPLGLGLKELRWVGIGLAFACIALLLPFFERLTGDRTAAFGWTLFFCAIPASGRLFFDLHPFDRFAIFFGVAAIACTQPWAVWLAVFAGAWTDERCLIASFWVLMLHTAMCLRTRDRRSAFCAAAVPMAWVAYALTRLWVWKSTGMTVATGGVNFNRLAVHIGNLPVAAFLSMETGWFVLAIALLSLLMVKRHRLIALMLGLAVGGGILASVLTIDMTRSLNHFWIALPALLAVVRWRLPELWTPGRLRVLGMVVAVTCLLLPSTECYLVGAPDSLDGSGGRMVLLGMFKPLPMRIVAWALGIPQG